VFRGKGKEKVVGTSKIAGKNKEKLAGSMVKVAGMNK
jgi:hypothetical protein